MLVHAPDDVTKRYLKNVSSIDIDIAPWFSDEDAKFLESHQFDATSTLVPFVSVMSIEFAGECGAAT